MDHDHGNNRDWTAFPVARAKTSSRPSHSALFTIFLFLP